MSSYGSIPLNITGTKLTAELVGELRDHAEDGIAFTSYDIMRTTGLRRKRIASLTIYEDGRVLITAGFGTSHANGVNDYAARDRLIAALESRYTVTNWLF